MNDITQFGLTFQQALKYFYLGDRIWNTWTGERYSVICDFYSPEWYDLRENYNPEEDGPIGYWSAMQYSGELPEKLTWGEVLQQCWCAETTSESV
jgi:hypothetical protein